MALAVFTVAGPLVNLVKTYPAQMRSIFFGMVAASVLVPLLMVRDDVSYRRKQLGLKHLIFFIVAAIVSFIVLSLPATLSLEQHWYIIMTVTAIAISSIVI